MNHVSIPIAIGFLLIASLSLVEGIMRDRWGAPGIEAAELGKRFQQVPKEGPELGDWVGEDLPVTEVTKKTAGAVSYVNRRYTNPKTGKSVTLWLIVGHSRDIVRHTPIICYPGQGFRQLGTPQKHYIETSGDEEAEFFTTVFSKEDDSGRHRERVFWAWNHPDKNKWEAPDSARFHYGLSRALYKMYFVSNEYDDGTIDSNAAVGFAELMLPVLNEALFPEESTGEQEASESEPDAASALE